MSHSYREIAITCPGCGAMMESHPISDGVIDRCLDCAGIWVDWFDGDLSGVTRQAGSARGHAASRRGSGDCPRCQRPLEVEHVGDSVLYATLRCGECAGAFIPRDAFEAVIAAPRAPERSERPSALAKLIAILKAYL